MCNRARAACGFWRETPGFKGRSGLGLQKAFLALEEGALGRGWGHVGDMHAQSTPQNPSEPCSGTRDLAETQEQRHDPTPLEENKSKLQVRSLKSKTPHNFTSSRS